MSASTRPRSCPRTRPDHSARDKPPVRPVLSASRRTKPSPACDTTPVPPPVTSRPFDHAVTFTSRVLLELEPVETSTPLQSQLRSTLLRQARRHPPYPCELTGLGLRVLVLARMHYRCWQMAQLTPGI